MKIRLAIPKCILIFLIVFSFFPSHLHMNVEANASFVDVPANAWYRGAVMDLSKLGVISGVGNQRFDPNGTVTRAQAAAFIAKAYDLNLNTTVANQFRDVPRNAWHYPYIGAVAEKGYIIGSNGMYMPTSNITRAQLVTVLLRSMGAPVNPNARSDFRDIRGHFFEKEINTAFQLGLTNGLTPTTFNPNGNVTRAEFAAFLYKDIIYSNLPGVKKSTPTLEVQNVQPITLQVSHQLPNQQLQFQVNHSQVTLDEVTKAGYQVEFLSTKDVFDNLSGTRSSTGILDSKKLSALFQAPVIDRTFQYQIVITKGNQVIQSEVTEATILDFNSLATEITSANVKRGNVGSTDITLKSNTLVTGEVYHLTDIKAVLKSGLRVNHLPNHVEFVQFQSSNTNVAIVNWRGEVTPISEGNATITVSSGAAKREFSFQVKSQRRTASTLLSNTNHVKMSSVDSIGFPIEQDVILTILDQYGDPIYNVSPQDVIDVNEIRIQQNNQTSMVVPTTLGSSNQGRTTLDGRLNLTLRPTANTAGTGTIDIFFKEPRRLAAKIDLTVSRFANPTSWKLESVGNTKLEIDRHLENVVTLRLKGFDSNGIYMGDQVFSGSSTFSVSSSDNQLVRVDTNFQDINLRVGTNELRTGKAKITAYQGAIPIVEIEVDVVDSKPRIHHIEFRNRNISNIHNGPLYIKGDIIQTFMLNTGEAVSYEVRDATTVHVNTASGQAAIIKIISNVLDQNKASSPAEFAIDENGEVMLKNTKTEDGSFQVGDKGEIYFIVYQLRETQAHATSIITVN